MRKNIQRVYAAWAHGRSCNEGSVSTDGHTIFSYATPILWRDKNGLLTLNLTGYSSTTSRSQNGLKLLLMTGVREWVVVEDGYRYHRGHQEHLN